MRRVSPCSAPTVTSTDHSRVGQDAVSARLPLPHVPGHRHPGPDAVLALQRAVGNEAVAHAVGGVVQRSESAAENGPDESDAVTIGIGEGLAMLGDSVVIWSTRRYFEAFYPRAGRHLTHYLEGSGATYLEDVGGLFRANPKAAARVAGMIRDNGTDSGVLVGRTTESAVIRQSDYTDEDWRLSLGGVDEIEYTVLDRETSGAAQVELTLRDPYEWHPAEDRPSKGMHQAMENQKANGAKDYLCEGTAIVTLIM